MMQTKQTPYHRAVLILILALLPVHLHFGCYAHRGKPIQMKPETLRTQILESCRRHDTIGAQHMVARLAEHPNQKHRDVREARALKEQENPCTLFYGTVN